MACSTPIDMSRTKHLYLGLREGGRRGDRKVVRVRDNSFKIVFSNGERKAALRKSQQYCCLNSTRIMIACVDILTHRGNLIALPVDEELHAMNRC